MRSPSQFRTERFSCSRSERRHTGMPLRRDCPTGPADFSIKLAICLLAMGGLLPLQPALAVEFTSGAIRGSLNTTISHGLTFRVEDRNRTLAEDTNGNDGDLNYKRGLVSNTSKFTTDIDIDAGDFGAFFRVAGFIDFENQNGTRGRSPLSREAKDKVGKNLDLLDAYVTGTFDAGDAAIDYRLGKHVLNWGESTFIPNGINSINPFDVSKLRLPGSELREALLPVSMASLSVAPNDTLSIEGFYQFDWEPVTIDPVGSYFSSIDYVGQGARKAIITQIREDDSPFGFGPLTQAINADLVRVSAKPQSAHDPDFASVLRSGDDNPEDSGQWGLAFRYLAEELNQTEFGFFYVNYHSRLPIVSAHMGSAVGIQDGLTAAGAVAGSATSPSHTAAAVGAGLQPDVAKGHIDAAAVPGIVGETLQGIASALAVDRYAKTGYYYLEYPEDIQLFGLSFNTVLGASGWALQGEYSWRRDAPLQRAERSVIAEGLAPIAKALALSGSPADLGSYLAGFTPQRVQGYILRDVSQYQATATRVFGPVMGADSLVFLTEVALMHVHGMPDRTEMPLESPAGGVLATGKADADATSWGYRVAARLDYNNAVGPVNLYPYTQFLHDVNGNSPTPSGPFVEGRTAVTLGLRADYLSRWQADIGYTRYGGDGNELSDRDFISASLKYSF